MALGHKPTHALIGLALLPALLFARPASASDGNIDTVVLIALLIILLYPMPAIVGSVRGHPNRWLIALINIVFGGTVLGWFGSLIWAMQAVHRSPTGNHGGESGLNLFANDLQAVRLEMPGPQPAASIDDISERVLRLKALHDRGVLSLAEYEALKREAIYGR